MLPIKGLLNYPRKVTEKDFVFLINKPTYTKKKPQRKYQHHGVGRLEVNVKC